MAAGADIDWSRYKHRSTVVGETGLLCHYIFLDGDFYVTVTALVSESAMAASESADYLPQLHGYCSRYRLEQIQA